jgi:hypothetical protein
MQPTENFIDPLLEKAGQYGKTSIELLKLKAVHKFADLTSGLVSRIALYIALSLFVMTVTIALGLWLGTVFGKSYYGFLVVSAFYLCLGIILRIAQPNAKRRINNKLIKKMLN